MKLKEDIMKLKAMNSDNDFARHALINGHDHKRTVRPTRACLPLRSVRLGVLASREYLRQLRAAEMAEWELNGGDYLMSRCATA
jgi:hypothetical protein